MIPWRSKIISDVAAWRAQLWSSRTVFTNGCFDLLHYGHIELLEEARSLGDQLVVAINSDTSVRALKGPDRPINPELQRMAVIAALESVSFCLIFHEKRCDRVLRAICPHTWAKGGDYSADTLDPDERHAAEELKTQIKIIPYVTGHSSSNTINTIRKSTSTSR